MEEERLRDCVWRPATGERRSTKRHLWMFDVCALRPMQHSERIYCVDLWQAMLARFAISRTVAHKPMPHSMWPIHLCMHCQYSVEWVFIVSRFLDHISLCGCVCVCIWTQSPIDSISRMYQSLQHILEHRIDIDAIGVCRIAAGHNCLICALLNTYVMNVFGHCTCWTYHATNTHALHIYGSLKCDGAIVKWCTWPVCQTIMFVYCLPLSFHYCYYHSYYYY